MLIHRQNSYALRNRRCTGRREAQSSEPVNEVEKKIYVLVFIVFFFLWRYSPISGLGFIRETSVFTSVS
jgi:hypothetical protein